MARRARGGGKRSARSTPPARRPGGARRRGIPWTVVGLLLVAAAALVALTQVPRRTRPAAPPGDAVAGIEEPEGAPTAGTAPPAARVAPAAPATAPAAAPRASAPPPPPPPPERARIDPKPAPTTLPLAAIVLDDCGQRLDLMERAVRIRQPLTFAVIPHLPHSRASAEAAFAAGHEVIVHQPMQPDGPDEDPGEGAIVSGMSPARVAKTLRASLDDVPHAVGLNNHMGSRATADARLMDAVLGSVAALSRRHPLYFLDSRTTPRTVALEAARRRGVRCAERDVFLDNEPDAAAIRGQVDRLVAEAASQGQAVAIGHLKPETLAVLEATLPALDGREVRFVFLGDLVR